MRTSALVLSATLLASSTPALAQPSATTGFPIGQKSRIHTELMLGVGFDSNRSRVDSTGDVSPKSPDPDARLNVRPGITIDVPGDSVSLNLGVHAWLTRYLGLSDQSAAETAVGGDLNAGFKLGSDRSKVGFILNDTLVRTPTYFDAPDTVASDEIRFRLWSNNGTARLRFRPGGGALEFDIGYLNRLSIFDELQSTMQHGALLEARYKFLPKTAIIFHSDFSTYNPVGSTVGDPTNPSTPFNITLGLIGQVTHRISVDLSAGYGDSLTWEGSTFGTLNSDANARTVIGMARITYAFNDTTSLSADYQRSIHPVIQLDNFVSNRFGVRAKIGIGARLALSGALGYQLRDYGRPDPGASAANANRSSQILSGGVGATYFFFEWLNAAVNYRVITQSGDGNDNDNQNLVAFLEDYNRHQVFFNIGLRY